jgi:arginine/serine-rich splicing factor 7
MSHGENTNCRVFIGDLPRHADERDIERSFRLYGCIKSVWMARNPPGFGEFSDPRDAQLNNVILSLVE